jgi:hypothetical protein
MNESSECEGCEEGCASCQGGSRFVLGPGLNQGAQRGGFEAGRGTMENWQGGALAENDEQRAPDTVDAPEQQGTSDAYRVVSPRERARSGQSYAEIYAEFVQKAEADLDLESVPLAYREYLRRYFRGIQPPEEAGEPDTD